MAFTVTARHSAAPTTTSATSRTTNSTTPTASSLLLVGVGAEHDTNNASAELSVSGGSLTWTDIQEIDGTASPGWNGNASYRLDAGLYRATVGASPSTFTTAAATTIGSYMPVVACDITGHDTTAPVVQSAANSATVAGTSSGHNATVTLSSAPTVGNLVVLFATAGADSGGGFSQPYAGAGNTFTAAHNQNGGYAQAYIGYRVVQSGDSSTIQIDDVGDSVGNWVLIAVEIAAESGGSTQLTVAPLDLAVTLDAVSLSQTHQLTVAALDLAVALDGVTLAVSSSLVVQPVDLAVVLDAVALTQAHTLTAQPLDLAVTLEQVTVTEHAAGSLLVQPLDLAVTLDAVALAQAHTLTAQPLDLAVTLEQVTVTVGVLQLQPDPLTLFVTVDVPQLAVTHVLAVQDMLLAVVLGSAESVAWSVWVGGVEQPAVVEGVWDGAVVQPAVTVEVVA